MEPDGPEEDGHDDVVERVHEPPFRLRFTLENVVVVRRERGRRPPGFGHGVASRLLSWQRQVLSFWRASAANFARARPVLVVVRAGAAFVKHG